MQKSRILGIAAGVLVLAGVGYALTGRTEATQTAPTTAAVTRATLSQTVLATGMIEASKLVSVGARTSGQIEEVAVGLGDRVTAGQLIARIDNLEQQNTVAQAKADLREITAQIEAKRATIRAAEASLTRAKTLEDKKLSSTAALETAQAAADLARAELQALEAQKSRAEISVSSAELDLARTTITAPMEATVVAVAVSEGQTVNANQETPTLVKLAALDEMIVRAEISEADVIAVQSGAKARFTLLGAPDQGFEAALDYVEPAPAEIETSDEISTDTAIYYIARLRVANPAGMLRIGMTAQVTIELASAENVLTLPTAALGTPQAGGVYQVEVYKNGAREAREIRTGLRTIAQTEILSGLEEGEEIVAATGSGASAVVQRRAPSSPMGF